MRCSSVHNSSCTLDGRVWAPGGACTSFPVTQSGEPNTAFCHLNVSYVNLPISGKHVRSGKDPHMCYTKVEKKKEIIEIGYKSREMCPFPEKGTHPISHPPNFLPLREAQRDHLFLRTPQLYRRGDALFAPDGRSAHTHSSATHCANQHISYPG